MSDTTPMTPAPIPPPEFITLKIGQIVFEPAAPNPCPMCGLSRDAVGISFYDAFKALMKQPLSATHSFQLAIMENRLLEQTKAYRQARLSSFQKHGKETSPDIWSLDGNPEAITAVQAELTELHEKPFVTTLPKKIKLTSDMKISGEAIRLLLDLVEV